MSQQARAPPAYPMAPAGPGVVTIDASPLSKFDVDASVSYQALQGELAARAGLQLDTLTVKWLDEDDDLITLGSIADLSEAVEDAFRRTSGILKVVLSGSPAPAFEHATVALARESVARAATATAASAAAAAATTVGTQAAAAAAASKTTGPASKTTGPATISDVLYLKAVRSGNNVQCVDVPGEARAVNTNRKGFEKIRFKYHNGSYYIQSVRNGNNLRCLPDMSVNFATKTEGLSEQWDIECKGDKVYLLSKHTNKVLQSTTAGELKCVNQNRMGWEKFQILNQDGSLAHADVLLLAPPAPSAAAAAATAVGTQSTSTSTGTSTAIFTTAMQEKKEAKERKQQLKMEKKVAKHEATKQAGKKGSKKKAAATTPASNTTCGLTPAMSADITALFTNTLLPQAVDAFEQRFTTTLLPQIVAAIAATSAPSTVPPPSARVAELGGDDVVVTVDLDLPACIREQQRDGCVSIELAHALGLHPAAATATPTLQDQEHEQVHGGEAAAAAAAALADVVTHPHVVCDGSGMNPIVGTRFHMVGYDYDLCEAEFLKLGEEDRLAYEVIASPASLPVRYVPWAAVYQTTADADQATADAVVETDVAAVASASETLVEVDVSAPQPIDAAIAVVDPTAVIPAIDAAVDDVVAVVAMEVTPEAIAAELAQVAAAASTVNGEATLAAVVSEPATDPTAVLSLLSVESLDTDDQASVVDTEGEDDQLEASSSCDDFVMVQDAPFGTAEAVNNPYSNRGKGDEPQHPSSTFLRCRCPAPDRGHPVGGSQCECKVTCPITHELFVDPVILLGGVSMQTYSRDAIVNHLNHQSNHHRTMTCPLTQAEIRFRPRDEGRIEKLLLPNREMLERVQEYERLLTLYNIACNAHLQEVIDAANEDAANEDAANEDAPADRPFQARFDRLNSASAQDDAIAQMQEMLRNAKKEGAKPWYKKWVAVICDVMRDFWSGIKGFWDQNGWTGFAKKILLVLCTPIVLAGAVVSATYGVLKDGVQNFAQRRSRVHVPTGSKSDNTTGQGRQSHTFSSGI